MFLQISTQPTTFVQPSILSPDTVNGMLARVTVCYGYV